MKMDKKLNKASFGIWLIS